MSSEFQLRQAVPEDAGAIRSLTREAYAKWVPVLGREPIPMAVDYDEAVRKHRFDLLYVAEDLVGLIETEEKDDYLLIENVAVRPNHQGKGFGRVLIAHAEQLAATAGYKDVKLYLPRLFADNLILYDRLGYRVEREEPIDRGTVVHMNKAL